jgi:glycine/D-amino acid oxidase-like deaminating enzyme
MAGQHAFDVTVIGGGLVGAALAYGLARKDLRVAVLDEGDVALRASRGNFGLVWVQGKGRGCPEYAQWSLTSATLWKVLAAELREVTDLDVGHENRGGVLLNLSTEEDAANRATLADIAAQAGNMRYEYEFLDRPDLEKLLPGLGEGVVSGSYSPHDGHANPLLLLRALHGAFVGAGGAYRPNSAVTGIEGADGGYRLTTASGAVESERIVIAAGLATGRLAGLVGLKAPVAPLRGQLMITERTAPRLELPTNLVRQTREGGFLLGYTTEDAGYDTGTRPDMLRDVAWRCRAAFPFLGDLRVVRMWAALRIMTPDGFPIYDQSRSHPGVYVVACHSGVTLAAVHVLRLPDWIAGEPLSPELRGFATERFDVQEAA